MQYYFLSILTLILGAIFSLFVKESFKLKVCTILSFVALIAGIFPIWNVLSTAVVYTKTLNWSLFGGVNFVLDPLSAIFGLVILVLGFLGLVYSNGYMKPYLNKGMNISAHCFFLMLLLASMLGVVTVQNALAFLVIWELMSLSSFFLVIFEGEKKEVLKAGIKYLVYMHLSVIFLIAMFAILVNYSGSLDFSDFPKVLIQSRGFANTVFILGFIGFGIKAGFVPFHNWLPDAHPAAPSHVSGIMSGVMIKTGIYGILRIISLMGVPSKFVSYMVLIIAVISLLYGILYAITPHDLKKLLAYSSIENIGIIGAGIALGMLGMTYANPIMIIFGFTGALLHIINHSIFKGLLFFGAGSVYLKTHTRNIECLGGLIKKMPFTASLFIIGSIAICALPPFNGFISELLIYAAMLLGLPSSGIGLFVVLIVSVASLALVGTVAMLCFTKASGMVFLGEPREEKISNITGDVEPIMLIPMGLLAVMALLIGLFPHQIMKLVISPLVLYVGGEATIAILQTLIGFMQVISWVVFGLLFFILALVGLKFIFNRKNVLHTTWGCGYNKPNSHMQYTASSYVNLFVSTLKPLFKRVSHIKKPKELFPKEAYFELEIEDIEEAYIVESIVKGDEKLLAKFERIQNGNIQQYILFGLIFLIIAIIGVIWIG